MQERRNKQQFILLIALLSATVSVYWFGIRPDGKNGVDKNLFKNFDLNTIDEILFESESGNVSLKYNGSRWRVNDQFPADPSMIDVLFATLRQAEPRRPVALSLRDSVAESLRRHGVKVSLKTAGVVQEIFFAGGNDAKSQAFFLKEGGDDPYIMTIPGYRVYVSGIFELTESGWRDKIVFGFNWRNFQRLEMTFPGRPKDNFNVALLENYFSVEGLAQVDTTKLNDFLDNVSLLTTEEFLTANDKLDSLGTVKPVVSILVLDIGRKEYRLQLYPPVGPRRRIYGLINQTQWALFQENKVDAVMRPRNFFEK